MNPTFTAAEIANALGTAARSVRRSLADVAPTGLRIVSGNQANAWEFLALPLAMREELEGRAKPNYRNAEHLLQEGCKPCAAAAPLESYGPEAIERARKLRDAFAPTFRRMKAPGISAGEMERIGLAEWRAVFKDGISGRHWRRYFEKFKGRWKVNGDEDRIEVYIVDAPALGNAGLKSSGVIPELENVVNAFADREAPTPKEKANLWTRTLEFFENEISAGNAEKETRRRVLKFLRTFASWIAKSDNGLAIQFSRKLRTWRANNGDVKAIADRRHTESGFSRAPEFTDADLNAVQAYMVGTFRNQGVPAFWHCLRAGLLSEAVTTYYRDKKECPRKLLKLLACQRDALADEHLGGNKTEMARPKIRRSYKDVFSNDYQMADDLTPCLYCYIPDGAGWYRLIRPQILVTVDFRTTCILGYAMIPEASYNARAIRTMFTRVADAHGIPRRGYYLENSIWRSHLVAGNQNRAALSNPEMEQGLREFGLEVRHAGAGKPWVKVIERVFDGLQLGLYANPGYCGTEERVNCPESFKRLKADVEARRKSPVGVLYSLEEFEERWQRECNRYNQTKQPDSEMIEGRSPMEAYQAFQKLDDPVSHFPAEIRYLFAHQKYEKTVSRSNGITIGQRRYICDGTGDHQGQRVIAWFDPEHEESIVVTDLERRNVWVAGRFAGDGVPAIDGGEQLAMAMKQSAAHVKPIKTLYRSLKAEFPIAFRKPMTTMKTLVLGAKIDAARRDLETQKEATEKAVARNRRASRDMGIPAQILGADQDDIARGLERLKRSGINLTAKTDEREAQP